MKRPASPYHRAHERVLLVLAAVGIALTLHLSFWYGDTVVDDPVCGGDSDCASVIAQDPTFFGISSTTSGFLFYVLVAVFSMGVTWDWNRRRRHFKAGRLGLVSGGLAYSLFLTMYQLFALEDFCVLCLASFGLVSAMAITLVLMLRKPPAVHRRRDVQANARNFHYIVAAAVAAVVLLDYMAYRDSAAASGVAATQAAVYNPALCRYDGALPRYDNLDQFISDSDPFTGPVSAPVTIVEFIDPNCQFCKSQHPVMLRLAAAYPDRVRIVYKLVPLLAGNLLFSLDEVMALWLANEEGRYEEMIEGVFAAQNPQGLSVAQLVDIAEEAGLNPRAFRQQLESRRLEPRARRIRRVFDQMGLNAVPAILISGRKVHSDDRSFGCLSHLVEQELANLVP